MKTIKTDSQRDWQTEEDLQKWMHSMAHTNTLIHGRHCNLQTELALWANSVKTNNLIFTIWHNIIYLVFKLFIILPLKKVLNLFCCKIPLRMLPQLPYSNHSIFIDYKLKVKYEEKKYTILNCSIQNNKLFSQQC